MPPETDRDRHFRTDHLKADFKGRSVRGGAVTMFAQACKFGLLIGSNVVLARMLTPQDYGLIDMVAAITGFVTMFKDLGLSMATVQKAEIDHAQISTLFWVNVAFSSAIALLTAAIAPVVAWFYGEPRLTLITLISASGLIFGGLSVQHQALLNRQMRFASIAAIEITSMLVGIATAIILAWYGAGYWALVFMQLAAAIATTVGVWVMCGWRPSLPVRHSGVRSMLTFGGNLTGFSVINYFARNLDNVLIGRYWGAQQLGLYAKAYSLLLLPIQQINMPITTVAVPSLSRLQHEPQQFRNYYLKALSLIASLTMPLAVLLIVIAEELVELLLGAQWREASAIFRILALSAFVQPICNTSGWLYISTGRTARMFRWGLFASSFIVMSFFVGLSYGARGVALCYAIAMLLQAWPCMYYATRGIAITMLDLLRAVRQPFLASLLAGVASFGVKLATEPSLPMWATAIISSIVLVLIYSTSMFYLFGSKDFFLSVLNQLKRQ